jgi:hypothetical protein
MAAVEIEIEAGCGGDCMCGGAKKPMAAEQNKDQMIAELKGLLSENGSNGQAERQVKIDEVIKKINEYGQSED